MTAVPKFRIVNGFMEVKWPEPLARSYEVATELLKDFVKSENERRTLRALLVALVAAISDHAIEPDDPAFLAAIAFLKSERVGGAG